MGRECEDGPENANERISLPSSSQLLAIIPVPVKAVLRRSEIDKARKLARRLCTPEIDRKMREATRREKETEGEWLDGRAV